MDSSAKVYRYLASQFRISHQEKRVQGFVTISRQAGAGGVTIGEKLALHLNKKLSGSVPWTVFDKKLVDVVLKEHKLSEKILPFLKEGKVAAIEDMIENLLGLHPSHAALVKRTTQTISRLAKMGRVILVGRGAPIITKELKGGVHVRLIGSLEKRKKHIKEYFRFNDKEAEHFIQTEDRGRVQYLKTYFDQDIDDPLIYDLVINTDKISYDNIAVLISELVIKKVKSEETILQKIEEITL